MKKYYTEISIEYYDSEDDLTIQLLDEFFVHAANKISAIKKVTNKAIELLKEETPLYEEIVSFNINTLYETTEDARL